MKALKCKPSALFAYGYSINILSKYSSLISHRPSMFEGRHIDYRSSKVDTSITNLRRSTHQSPIFEGRHINHRSSKVNTSISEGRHIDLRKSTHRSPKVDTSIIDLRKSTHRSSKLEGGNITPTIRLRILSTTALLKVPGVDEVTHAHTHIHVYNKNKILIIFNIRQSVTATHA